jgi:antitoxin component YwqK of YwqJK toxin-antitoxin module|uniref:toxin-antitoxin system YwqK family antitoxin n=1 Tax=Cephaloticoccus sp. TaxID=1985742 RepID=UPI004049DCAF
MRFFPKRFLCSVTTFICLSAVSWLQADETTSKPDPEVRGTKVNGVYDGKVEIWSTPTVKQAAGGFANGEPDGTWTFWDESGTKIVEFNYQLGPFTGAVTMWYDTSAGPRIRGKIKFRGSFDDGMWAGSVLTYYPDGKMRSERVYTDGVVTQSYAYNPRGQTLSEEDAKRVATEDESTDNAYVDALDEFIRKWACADAE